ncbi:glycosyltransferase family 2 protein [Paracoccus sp. (in: a-proteobacteria)]|uniref:glycosyltransferase n=1 Tax=Paracoccus sp. TaxID=267 RepID=UPI0026DF3CB2|nr:glycosyltransferase family 2 protein [Paracoccus sp. (in: a-proteobacteria)]MDO5370384.1 glycosyltransferase [Paracoccus sp. (in: a-proteobacteria)]
MSDPVLRDAVLIGICTFRRPELAATLDSLARLDPCGLPLSVAIADNDRAPSARDRVQAIAATHPLPITYLHAPEANISIARNALLDHARNTGARLLVYLDDDERAEPSWLARLVAGWRAGQQSGAGIGAVLGPVRAHYPAGAPGWMDRARAHDTLPVFGKDGTVRSGYSGNTLIDLADPAAQGLRFDLSRGRAGGEDSAFFADFLAAGGRIGFAPDAVVHEDVPPGRARLAWLLRRRYRMGQTHASLIARGRSRGERLGAAGVAAAKAMACGGLALLGAARPAWRNRQIMRAALHVGAAAHLGGAPQIEIYGTAPGRTDPAPRQAPKEN